MFYLYTLVSFLALYTTAFSFGAIVFQFIQRAFPDMLVYSGNMLSAASRYYIASLIVAFPLYVILMWLVWRETKTSQSSLDSGVRKWFTYITLVGVAGVMLGDLIAVVSNMLGGELAIRFILKAGTIFLIASAIFGYYLFDLRRKAGGAFPLGAKALAGVVVVLIIGAVSFGISLIGTPGTQRAIQFDQTRISDLQQISFAVDAYWQNNGVLPANFDALKNQQMYYIQSVSDPKTGNAYGYAITGSKTYELCATFETDSSQYATRLKTPVAFSNQQWNYGKGRTCFSKEEVQLKKP